MPVKRLWHIECMESSGIDVGDADARRILQGGQAGRCFGLAPLDHAQTFTQYFAGILVTAGGYKSFDHCGLMIGQYDITRWHVYLTCRLLA